MTVPAPTRRLVLASGSQPRRRLLEAAGFAPEVVVSGVDEDGVDRLAAEKAALELAERKAAAVAASLGAPSERGRPSSKPPPSSTRSSSGQSRANPDERGTGPDSGDKRRSASASAAGFEASGWGTTDPGDRGQGGADLPALVLACDTILLMDGVPYGKPSSLDEARDWVTRQRNQEVEVVTGHCLIDTATGRRVGGASLATVSIGAITDDEIEAYLATGEALKAAGALTIDGYGAPFIAGIEGDHGTVVGLSLPVVRDLLAELDIPIASLWSV